MINNIFAEDYAPHSLTGTSCAVDDSGGYADGPSGQNDSFSDFTTEDHAFRAVDDPGGDIDDPGGGTTNDWDSFSYLATSASTSSKASASYISSSLTTRVSLLSLSDKSTADVVECADVDYATGSFCSSCSIPPPMAGSRLLV